MNKRIGLLIAAIAVVLGCRAWFSGKDSTGPSIAIYVPEGKSLLLRYKGPLLFTWGNKYAARGQFAEEGEIGVMKMMPGPGRHFYCPIWWERTLVPDVVVQPGELAIVTSKLGDDLPSGQFLVDGDLGETKSKGILRRTFGPGRYRINPYGYEDGIVKTEQVDVGDGQIKYSGWIHVYPGYVGVVTYLTDNPALGRKAGIQSDTLPPGLYPINPREMQIDMVSIGYNAKELSTEKKKDENGKDRARRKRRRAAGPRHGHQFSLQRRLQDLHGLQRRLGHHAAAGPGHHPPFRQYRRRRAEGDRSAMRKHLPQQRLETRGRRIAGRRQPPEVPGRRGRFLQQNPQGKEHQPALRTWSATSIFPRKCASRSKKDTWPTNWR